MPSKKKKYNARFPAGRIKKIMQSDEEVGKVAQAVPIIISRTLELFVESMLTKTLRITNARNAKTLSPSHIKQCIMTEMQFDFLRELVKNVPDINIAEEQQSDNYPESRESSEEATSSPKPQSESVGSNGAPSNAADATGAKRSFNEANAGSSSGGSSQWKFAKQHSLDSIAHKNQNFYTASANDSRTPNNYSIKIEMEDHSGAMKLSRVDSTPASFGSNNNLILPMITANNFLPVATTNVSEPSKPVITFDFTNIPLLPLASSSQTASTSNHSHSVSNILKNNEKPIPAQESQANVTKASQRTPTNKTQSTKSTSHTTTSTSASVSPPTVATNPSTLQSNSSSVMPIMSYNMPLSSSTLEMDEDYDNL